MVICPVADLLICLHVPSLQGDQRIVKFLQFTIFLSLETSEYSKHFAFQVEELYHSKS